jgi:hypothetical protein
MHVCQLYPAESCLQSCAMLTFNAYNNASCRWKQTDDDISVFVAVPPGTRAAEVQVQQSMCATTFGTLS